MLSSNNQVHYLNFKDHFNTRIILVVSEKLRPAKLLPPLGKDVLPVIMMGEEIYKDGNG